MKFEIHSKKSYHEAMISIYKLMEKGEGNLTKSELKKLELMSKMAEKYEDEVLGLQPRKKPKSITELVEIKLFEQKMTQSKLAENMGMAPSKLSEILSGKRKPDILFLKGIYKVLKIDPAFLLDHA